MSYGRLPTVVYSSGYPRPATPVASARNTYAAPAVSYKAAASYVTQQYTPSTTYASQQSLAPVRQKTAPLPVSAKQQYIVPADKDEQNCAMEASPRFQDFSLVGLDESKQSMSIYLGKPTLILNCATL